jgi:D-alanine transaminase
MPNVAFIAGRFMPLSRARVSVEDRGYQFGDGVYEVIRTYGGKLFRAEAHLDRLDRSAAAIGLTSVYSRQRWLRLLEEAFKRSRFNEAKVYIQITRGAAPREHAFPERGRPTVVVTVRKLVPFPERFWKEGVRVITLPDLRWGRCDIKTINLLPNVLAKQQAARSGVFEALFVREGRVIEASSANLFAVVHDTITTPPKGPNLLSGITREVVLDLARREGLAVEERDLPRSELRAASEVFLTGTTIEVLPVVRVDDGPVGEGVPGKVACLLRRRFQEVLLL